MNYTCCILGGARIPSNPLTFNFNETRRAGDYFNQIGLSHGALTDPEHNFLRYSSKFGSKHERYETIRAFNRRVGCNIDYVPAICQNAELINKKLLTYRNCIPLNASFVDPSFTGNIDIHGITNTAFGYAYGNVLQEPEGTSIRVSPGFKRDKKTMYCGYTYLSDLAGKGDFGDRIDRMFVESGEKGVKIIEFLLNLGEAQRSGDLLPPEISNMFAHEFKQDITGDDEDLVNFDFELKQLDTSGDKILPFSRVLVRLISLFYIGDPKQININKKINNGIVCYFDRYLFHGDGNVEIGHEMYTKHIMLPEKYYQNPEHRDEIERHNKSMIYQGEMVYPELSDSEKKELEENPDMTPRSPPPPEFYRSDIQYLIMQVAHVFDPDEYEAEEVLFDNKEIAKIIQDEDIPRDQWPACVVIEYRTKKMRYFAKFYEDPENLYGVLSAARHRVPMGRSVNSRVFFDGEVVTWDHALYYLLAFNKEQYGNYGFVVNNSRSVEYLCRSENAVIPQYYSVQKGYIDGRYTRIFVSNEFGRNFFFNIATNRYLMENDWAYTYLLHVNTKSYTELTELNEFEEPFVTMIGENINFYRRFNDDSVGFRWDVKMWSALYTNFTLQPDCENISTFVIAENGPLLIGVAGDRTLIGATPAISEFENEEDSERTETESVENLSVAPTEIITQPDIVSPEVIVIDSDGEDSVHIKEENERPSVEAIEPPTKRRRLE